MKKILLFAAAMSTLALYSCNEGAVAMNEDGNSSAIGSSQFSQSSSSGTIGSSSSYIEGQSSSSGSLSNTGNKACLASMGGSDIACIQQAEANLTDELCASADNSSGGTITAVPSCPNSADTTCETLFSPADSSNISGMYYDGAYSAGFPEQTISNYFYGAEGSMMASFICAGM